MNDLINCIHTETAQQRPPEYYCSSIGKHNKKRTNEFTTVTSQRHPVQSHTTDKLIQHDSDKKWLVIEDRMRYARWICARKLYRQVIIITIIQCWCHCHYSATSTRKKQETAEEIQSQLYHCSSPSKREGTEKNCEPIIGLDLRLEQQNYATKQKFIHMILHSNVSSLTATLLVWLHEHCRPICTHVTSHWYKSRAL